MVLIIGSTIAVPIPDKEKKEKSIKRFDETPLPKAEILNIKSPINRMVFGFILTLKAPIINAENRATKNAMDLICAITPIGCPKASPSSRRLREDTMLEGYVEKVENIRAIRIERLRFSVSFDSNINSH
jgi:hypothetical protein